MEFSLTDELIARGANGAQLKSNVVTWVEEILAEHEGIVPKESCAKAEYINNALDRSTREMSNITKELDSIKQKLKEDSSLVKEALEKQEGYFISNHTKEGFFLFADMLKATKEIFGEDKMTESVIITALESASYGLWRAIMGPKEQEKDSKVFRR